MDIGRKQIAPLISRFSDRYPAIQVHLALSDAGGDLIDDGIDIALRVILPADTSILVRKVLSTKRVACASPEYIKKYGTPATPEDLLKHNCICLVRGRRVFDSWVFHNGPKRIEVRVKGNLTTTSGEVMMIGLWPEKESLLRPSGMSPKTSRVEGSCRFSPSTGAMR